MTFHSPLPTSMKARLLVTKKLYDGVSGILCHLWPAEHHPELRNLGQSAEYCSGENQAVDCSHVFLTRTTPPHII